MITPSKSFRLAARSSLSIVPLGGNGLSDKLSEDRIARMPPQIPAPYTKETWFYKGDVLEVCQRMMDTIFIPVNPSGYSTLQYHLLERPNLRRGIGRRREDTKSWSPPT